jgi:eukaryotic-like serine/threonine-protein kinase
MATQAGVLLGTAAYMSPEQAKAKPVDRRADIWAFGCVLYEMLTGKMAFHGESVTDTLAAVIKEEPDWSQLPAATPVRVRVLLQRCLQKDPKQRLRDIGDARISLDEVLSGAPEATPALPAAHPAWRRPIPWVVGVLAAGISGVAVWILKPTPPPPPAQLLRYEIPPPEKTSFGTNFDLSPDGRRLAFTVTAQDGHRQLWVRDLDSLVSKPVSRTEGADSPFWSPDSRMVAFQAGDKLERVDIAGGAPQMICDATYILGGLWNPDGVIVIGSYEGLRRVSATGGTLSVLTKLDASRGEVVHVPLSFLPDGLRFLYYRGVGPGAGTYVGSLDAGGGQPNPKPLVPGAALYLPASSPGPGWLVFQQANGTLMAQSFDASRAELAGDPAPIAENVNRSTAVERRFTVSASGLLAYSGGNSTPLQLTWFDRQGKVLGTVGEAGIIQPSPAISPDGSSVVASRTDLQTGGRDLWLYNLPKGTQSRLTFDGKGNEDPVWSPDGSHVAFLSLREGILNVYQKAINGMGQEEPFEKAPNSIRVPLDWSRDGRFLVEGSASGNKLTLWVLPLSTEQAGGDHTSAAYLLEGFNPKLSPNGQWMACGSLETGRDEIFVHTFPKPGGKWPVSVNGGTRPVWSRDGKELYFIALDGKLMAVQVATGPGGAFQGGAPKALFDPHIAGDRTDTFDVAKDGRFLIPVVAGQSGGPITVVVNWPSLLKK